MWSMVNWTDIFEACSIRNWFYWTVQECYRFFNKWTSCVSFLKITFLTFPWWNLPRLVGWWISYLHGSFFFRKIRTAHWRYWRALHPFSSFITRIEFYGFWQFPLFNLERNDQNRFSLIWIDWILISLC